ncbi:uncharacterized protein [Clytia hemisphaerica]|uniref:Uncharacterized protein n=2 Tax=Clytia hemisphaerica TaxID=252671 RepID=A0A7M5TYV5_9CNID
MAVKHSLLILIVSGGLIALMGFVLTMFGFASSCNKPPRCLKSENSRILSYKIFGPMLFFFGLAASGAGIILKWRLKPKHLRLEYRVSSIEGTNFTGDTTLETAESPVNVTPTEVTFSPNFTTTTSMQITEPVTVSNDGTDHAVGEPSTVEKQYNSPPWVPSMLAPPTYEEVCSKPAEKECSSAKLQDHSEQEGVDVTDADVSDFVINEDELEDEVFEADDTEESEVYEIQNLIHGKNCSEA